MRTCRCACGLHRGQNPAASVPSGKVTVIVRDRSSSHSPHHATVGQDPAGASGRSARRRASTRTGFRSPAGLRERWAVRFSVVQPDARAASMAGMRFLASFPRPSRVAASHVARSWRRLGVGLVVRMGGSRGPNLAPLWGVVLTQAPYRVETGPVSNRDGGSRTETGGAMRC